MKLVLLNTVNGPVAVSPASVVSVSALPFDRDLGHHQVLVVLSAGAPIFVTEPTPASEGGSARGALSWVCSCLGLWVIDPLR